MGRPASDPLAGVEFFTCSGDECARRQAGHVRGDHRPRVAAAAVAGDRRTGAPAAACLWRCAMTALLIGYARVSTDAQDLTAQRDGLLALGVDAGRIHVNHGLTGTNRERPGLREALAACREATPWWRPSSTGWPGRCPT